MKLPSLIKREPAAHVLAAARAKRAELATRLVELAAGRAAALVESDDDLSVVKAVDEQIAAATRDAGVLDDRIAALALVIRERRAEEAERGRLAAIAVVAQRGDEEIELAKQVERDMRRFADSWLKMIAWRSRMTRDWPVGLPLPPVDAFADLRDLMREGGMMYFGLGNPTAERRSSLPNAVAPVAVRGLEPLGVVGYVTAAIGGFVARLRNTRIQPPDDDEEIAA